MQSLALSDKEYLVYVVLTNYLTIFSGVLFLLAFIILGLVALRVSRVFGIKTHWPLFFIGPIGALVYSVYTIVHGSGPTASAGAFAFERWVAYGSFLACGVLCWLGVYRFWTAVRVLVKEGQKVKDKYV